MSQTSNDPCSARTKIHKKRTAMVEELNSKGDAITHMVLTRS